MRASSPTPTPCKRTYIVHAFQRDLAVTRCLVAHRTKHIASQTNQGEPQPAPPQLPSRRLKHPNASAATCHALPTAGVPPPPLPVSTGPQPPTPLLRQPAVAERPRATPLVGPSVPSRVAKRHSAGCTQVPRNTQHSHHNASRAAFRASRSAFPLLLLRCPLPPPLLAQVAPRPPPRPPSAPQPLPSPSPPRRAAIAAAAAATF